MAVPPRTRRPRLVIGGLLALALAAVLAPLASARVDRALHGTIIVKKTGTGTGVVVGRPTVPDNIETPINCGPQCVANAADVTDPRYVPYTLTATADPGSEFKGWGGACAFAGTQATCALPKVERLVNYEIEARFDRQSASSYPVVVALDGSGSVASQPAGIRCSPTCAASFATGSAVTLTATPAAGWTFGGWSGACSGAAPCALTIDGPKSVTARFVPPGFQVSVAVAGSGAVASSAGGIECGSRCVGELPGGTATRLTATPSPGATLVGWGGACRGSAPECDLTVSSPTAVTAVFSGATGLPLAVAVGGSGAVRSAPEGIACGARCGAAFPRGTTVRLTATPAGGARFVGWSGACRGTSPTCTVRTSAARAVVALFASAAKQTLGVSTSGDGTVTSAPAGIACGSRCTASFAGGSVVTLTAAARPRSGFVRWSGACSGSRPTCRVRMDGPRSVTAQFAPLADQIAPRVRALPSSGAAGTPVRLRYRVTENSGRSREWATVYDGGRPLTTVKGPLDAVDPDALFSFLLWQAPASTKGSTLRFCVWAADPSGNTSAKSCSTVRLT